MWTIRSSITDSSLDSNVQNDRTYRVPGHSIIDNLFVIRDRLDPSRLLNVNFGLVSLDQEKAFNKVNLKYLFNALSGFGCDLMHDQGGGKGAHRPVRIGRDIR